MNQKGKTIILAVSSSLLLGVLTMNLTGSLPALLSTGEMKEFIDPVSIDFVTIQSLVKAVKIKEIPAKSFVQTIDSLNQTWDSRGVRNPFVKKAKRRSRIQPVQKKKTPEKKVTKERPKITVNGIVWDEARPYAILNGEIYGVGDELEGYTIQAIVDTLIFLSSPDDIFTVKYLRE